MKCPHCTITVFDEFKLVDSLFNSDDPDALDTIKTPYFLKRMICPSCLNPILKMTFGQQSFDDYAGNYLSQSKDVIVYPSFCNVECSNEVPDKYKKDYLEAYAIKDISPKACAALCRRLLQQLLRTEGNIKPAKLSREIDEFLKTPGLPSYITDDLHSLRKIGNFASHPTDDICGQLIDVEPDEVDWCLNIVQSLFDYFIIGPVKAKQRREKLENKLSNE